MPLFHVGGSCLPLECPTNHVVYECKITKWPIVQKIWLHHKECDNKNIKIVSSQLHGVLMSTIQGVPTTFVERVWDVPNFKRFLFLFSHKMYQCCFLLLNFSDVSDSFTFQTS